LELLIEAVSSGDRKLVMPINAATVVQAEGETSIRSALQDMDLLIPDGFWLQVASRVSGNGSTCHVPTASLLYTLLGVLSGRKERVFLLGAKPDVVARTARELERRFPGLRIVGMRDGYFSEMEEGEVVRAVRQAKPRLLLLGISSPKREYFVNRQKGNLAGMVTLGVGGLFDILAGEVAEGPMWLRRYGLMWLFRFLQEPRRLWRRYTLVNVQFIWLVLKQAFSGRPGVGDLG
jgi:N-acetylglucosaminyldiphosphoundecaprenol N-acetyl-beta-D-mannosaminyltransferase